MALVARHYSCCHQCSSCRMLANAGTASQPWLLPATLLAMLWSLLLLTVDDHRDSRLLSCCSACSFDREYIYMGMEP